jgi:serine/threonine-protein kinase HipA
MVFNVIARNMDDHTKNLAFIMNEEGKWSLSPAYDVTYAYNPANKWLARHQMSVNGKRENITRDDFLMVGKQMNIKKAREIIERVKSVAENWVGYAKQAGIPENQAKEIASTHLLNL